jgi:hypothetical protein
LGVYQYNIAGFDTQGTACYTIAAYLLVSGTPTILVTKVFFASVNHYKATASRINLAAQQILLLIAYTKTF